MRSVLARLLLGISVLVAFGSLASEHSWAAGGAAEEGHDEHGKDKAQCFWSFLSCRQTCLTFPLVRKKLR